MVVAGRRKPPLDEVVAEIARAGGQAAARRADMESPADPVDLAEWTIKTFGRVDVLINNAGHSSTGRAIRWVKKTDWDSVMVPTIQRDTSEDIRVARSMGGPER